MTLLSSNLPNRMEKDCRDYHHRDSPHHLGEWQIVFNLTSDKVTSRSLEKEEEDDEEENQTRLTDRDQLHQQDLLVRPAVGYMKIV